LAQEEFCFQQKKLFTHTRRGRKQNVATTTMKFQLYYFCTEFGRDHEKWILASRGSVKMRGWFIIEFFSGNYGIKTWMILLTHSNKRSARFFRSNQQKSARVWC